MSNRPRKSAVEATRSFPSSAMTLPTKYGSPQFANETCGPRSNKHDLPRSRPGGEDARRTRRRRQPPDDQDTFCPLKPCPDVAVSCRTTTGVFRENAHAVGRGIPTMGKLATSMFACSRHITGRALNATCLQLQERERR
jgi:hypothetical protein